MIERIEAAAKSVGIIAVISGSQTTIDVQLNGLTRDSHLPIMLISWDIDVSLEFDTNGYLKNPQAKVIALLVTKPEDLTKEDAKLKAQEMGKLFQRFLIKLRELVVSVTLDPTKTITGAGYKMLPWYGIAKHSGVLGRFTVSDNPESIC